MPTLTVKTEYIDQLKAFDCYDKWLEEVKAQWLTYIRPTDWLDSGAWKLVLHGFRWVSSVYGETYWATIHKQLTPYHANIHH